MKRTTLSLAMATLSALWLTGCGATSAASTPLVQTANGTSLLAAASSPGAVMEAEIDGTLARSDDGCLGLDAAGTFTVLLFPYGTELADDGASATVPDLGELRPGDEIDGGGGYISVDDVPELCAVGDELAVWQTVD